MKRMFFLIVLLCTPVSAWAEDSRTEFFDTQLMPLVEELFGSDRQPTLGEFEDLAAMVHRLNELHSTRVTQKTVHLLDMDPLTWRTMLNELVPKTAAIAFCSSSVAGLRPCADAAKHLQIMTNKCSRTVLGLIDLVVGEEMVPLNLFQDAFPDPGDPNFIMLKRKEKGGYLSPVRFAGSNTSPVAIAAVLCPEKLNPLQGFGLQ